MKLDVTFAEDTQSFEAEMSSEQPFAADFGEFQTLHNGQNGATFTPSVSAAGVISWSNDRGLPNPDPVNIKGPQGEQGPQGIAGETGPRGPQGDAGPQGIQGVKGDKGDKGDTGANGKDGADGYTPVKGVDYFDGTPGKDGTDGQPGKDGADGQPGKDGVDGYTPIKGTDYFTEADKAELVSAVISQLPIYGGEVVAV